MVDSGRKAAMRKTYFLVAAAERRLMQANKPIALVVVILSCVVHTSWMLDILNIGNTVTIGVALTCEPSDCHIDLDPNCSDTRSVMMFTDDVHQFLVGTTHVMAIKTRVWPSVFHLYRYFQSSIKQEVNRFVVDSRLSSLVPYSLMPLQYQKQFVYEIQSNETSNGTGHTNSCLTAFHTAETPGCGVTLQNVALERSLRTLIRQLLWSAVIIVFDECHESYIGSITSSLTDVLITTLRISNRTQDDQIAVAQSSKRTCADFYDGAKTRNGTEFSTETLDYLLKRMYTCVPSDDTINVVVVCSTGGIRSLLQAANKFDRTNKRSSAMHLRSRWLVPIMSVSDKRDLGEFMKSLDQLDNVAVIEVFRTDCPSGHPAYDDEDANITDVMVDTRPFGVWTFDPTADMKTLVESVLKAPYTDSADTVSRVQTLYYGANRTRYLVDVALVTSSGDVVFVAEPGVFPNTRFGLNNRKLLVATINYPPFIIRDTSGDNHTVFTGLCIDILNYLQDVLNFTSVMVDPPEEEFGTPSNQSVFSGLIGMLQRKEVDLVMAPLAIDPLRDEVIDFTFPFFTETTLMVLRKPDPAEKKWLTLIRPFDWQVHIAIFISLLVVTALVTFLERINPYYRHKAIKSELHGIVDSLMYMFGALINQGGEQLPRSATGRTLLTFWWLYCIVVSSTYSGNLIAFLTVTKEPVPFYSLQGMLGQDKFKWGVMGKSIYEMLFQYSEDPVKQAMWERIRKVNQSDPSVLSLNVNEHFGKVKREDYAFIVEKSITDYWQVDECDHILIQENLFTLHYAVGLVKGSPYTDLFSEHVKHMCEYGLMTIWGRRWWPRRSVCSGPVVTEAPGCTVLDVQSAFYLLVVGVLGSALVLGLEHLVGIWKEWKTNLFLAWSRG